jgi:hypothetical protein
MTFAMACHAAADLSQTLGTTPRRHGHNRLPATELAELRTVLQDAGIPLREGTDADAELARLRQMYEPYLGALADRLLMPLPHWRAAPEARDAWQTTACGVEPWDVARDGDPDGESAASVPGLPAMSCQRRGARARHRAG